MISRQKAQTGARVYRGVGQSPNMGQVSAKGAQGYLQREMRKNGPQRPIGNDGKSDSRSGVAAAALRRNGGPSWQGNSRGNKNKPPSKTNSSASTGAGGGSSKTPSVSPSPVPVNPPVQVSNTGTLELPYDQGFSADQVAATNEANQALLDLQLEEQQADLDFAQQSRDANLMYEEDKKLDLSEAGGRGTVFSSMYGKQVADQATNHTNTLATLTNENNRIKSSAAMRRAAIQSALAMQLAAGTQAYGDQLGDEAGTLGFGIAATPTPGAPTKKAPPKKFGHKNAGNAVAVATGKRPPKPTPNHVWRDGRWVKGK